MGLTVALAIVVVVLVVVLGVLFQRLSALRTRYSGIDDVDAAIAAKRRDAEAELEARSRTAQAELQQLADQAAKLRSERDGLSAELKTGREALESDLGPLKDARDGLQREVSALEENLEDISFGVYKPHFGYDTPEEYKTKLGEISAEQKRMVKSGEAATCSVSWTVGDSRKEGERMAKQYTKLLLRAFNGECDAAIAKVTWNNVTKMEERIRKSFEAVNKLGSVMSMSITQDYADLMVRELQLEHELKEKKRQIAEEQRLIRQQMREEQRAQKELERAQQEAQDEESRFSKLLEKGRLEAAKAKGEEHARLNARLVELEGKLAEATAKTQKAKAIAELTKAGYVYIISNIGSFGDKVFKIGMTRREDPMDRVKELGDASVPFPFDVHAMIYSEDAPAVEADIQNRFGPHAVNLVNNRKEFFNVSIDEIEAYVKEKNLTIHFTRLAEAREYRETYALREAAAGKGATS